VDIKMIKDDIKPQDIPKIIKEAVEEYNHKFGIGETKRIKKS
jgi:hypothetical protein